MNRRVQRGILIGVLVLAAAGESRARAQGAAAEEKELGWASTAELSLIATSGNAETTTFGARGKTIRTWKEAQLTLEAGALRAEETDRIFRAFVSDAGEVTLVEDEDTEITAESYLLRGQYDRTLTGRLFAFGGAGWERNELAGVDSRSFVAAGVGHAWAETEALKSRTSYGVTYTLEEETSGREAEFLGLRLTWDYLRRLTGNTIYTHQLILDENLDDTDDYRGDLTGAVAVAMTERLALKVSLRLLYDHVPAMEEVPIELSGVPTGDFVLVELDELDTILTAALVVSF